MNNNGNGVLSLEQGKKVAKRNMVLLLAGLMVSRFGSRIYSFAMSLYILDVTGSGLSFSLTLALSSLPMIILSPVSGVVADKVSRKKLIVGMDILSGIIVLGLFGISMVNGMQIGYIYLATFLLSICATFLGTTFAASYPNIVDKDNLTRLNSLARSVNSIADIGGPFLGGFIFALVDIRLFLLINGVSFIISGISECFIDFKLSEKLYGITSKGQEVAKNFWGDLKEGASYIKNEKWLLWLGGFLVVLNMTLMMGVSVSMPVITREVLGFSNEQYGLLSATFAGGTLVGSLVLAMKKENNNPFNQIIRCIFLMGGAVISMGIVFSGVLGNLQNSQILILIMICCIAISISGIFVDVPLGVMIQKQVPNEKLGRVFGVLSTFTAALSPLGAILGGVLIDRVTPWMLPLVSGVIVIVFAILMSRSKELRGMNEEESKNNREGLVKEGV